MNKLSKRQKSSPTDKVPGGLGQFTSPGDVDAKELEKGISVEYEHTPNTDIAQDIALDHLTEISDYYTRLEKMEEESKEEGSFKDIDKVCNLIYNLIKIATKLDEKGLYKEADEIDELISKASMGATNALIRALKNNDKKEAVSIMSRISREDLQLTEQEFREFANAIRLGLLHNAKAILGITFEEEDPELGRLPVSKHLKDIFTPDRETITIKDMVEGSLSGLHTNNKRG